MQELNKKTVTTTELPIKVLQFGEGNFLRAFADWMIDIMNVDHGFNHGVAVIQPIAQGTTDILRKQDNLYHHIYRGLKDGKATSEIRLIRCIQKSINPFETKDEYEALVLLDELEIVISNTTEDGIVFKKSDLLQEGILPTTFPGKVTQLLWNRYNHFDGAPDKGLKFLPVELIDKNGVKLKEAILNYARLWQLPNSFINWIQKHNYFANTLVDRIVPGYPKEDVEAIQTVLGFNDNLIVSSELAHLWVIEGPKEIQQAFPADKCGLNVIYTDDLASYRSRKVRILNGSHTCMVPVGLLHGIVTVRESMEDESVGAFIRNIIYNEIIPTIDLPKQVLEAYAEEVFERFKNPYIRHELKSIALNSISKFHVRVLPSLIDYFNANQALPGRLVLAFTYLIKLYLTDTIPIQDNEEVKTFFENLRVDSNIPEKIICKVLGNQNFWKTDLNLIDGLPELMTTQLELLNGGAKIHDFISKEV